MGQPPVPNTWASPPPPGYPPAGDQPTLSGPSGPTKSRRVALRGAVAATVLVIAAAAVVLFWRPGLLVADQSADLPLVEAEVTKLLLLAPPGGYGLSNVSDVQCTATSQPEVYACHAEAGEMIISFTATEDGSTYRLSVDLPDPSEIPVPGTPALPDPGRTVFHVPSVEEGVTSILTGQPPAGYGLAGISDVRCPEAGDITVQAGATFTCSLAQDGDAKTVTVVVKSDDGTYEVGIPM